MLPAWWWVTPSAPPPEPPGWSSDSRIKMLKEGRHTEEAVSSSSSSSWPQIYWSLPVLGEVCLQVVVFWQEELCDLWRPGHRLVAPEQFVAVALQELHALDGPLGSVLFEAAPPGLTWVGKDEREHWLIIKSLKLSHYYTHHEPLDDVNKVDSI